MGKVGVVALGAIVVVDIALVTLAIQHVRGGPAGNVAESTPTATATGPPAARTPSQPERRPSPTDPGVGVRPTSNPAVTSRTLIDLGDGDAVVRARTGACGEGGARVELSVDGGWTFAPAEVPGAEVVLRVAADDAESSWLVGTDEDCEDYTVYRTSDGGQTWDASPGSDGAWHRTNRDEAVVHAPEGLVTAPCSPGAAAVDLAVVSVETAFVLCGDGELLRTRSMGDDWSGRTSLDVPLTMDFVDDSAGLLVAYRPEQCAGLAVLQTDDGGTSWTPLSCIEATGRRHPHLSYDGERAYLAQGKAVWFSADAGEEWVRRSS